MLVGVLVKMHNWSCWLYARACTHVSSRAFDQMILCGKFTEYIFHEEDKGDENARIGHRKTYPQSYHSCFRSFPKVIQSKCDGSYDINDHLVSVGNCVDIWDIAAPFPAAIDRNIRAPLATIYCLHLWPCETSTVTWRTFLHLYGYGWVRIQYE